MSPSSSALRRTLVAFGAIAMLGGASVGIASAQATPTPAQPAQSQPRPDPQAFLDALARRLNVSADALRQAMTQARTDVGLPADGAGFGLGPGHGPGRGGRGADLTSAAQAIGISVDQLRQELPGKSLAQVAQAHGKTATEVATALKNAANQRIDQDVTAGRLTAAEATQRKQDVAQRIDQQVNEVRQQGQPDQRGPAGPRPTVTPSGA
jgi:hypothetical protein